MHASAPRSVELSAPAFAFFRLLDPGFLGVGEDLGGDHEGLDVAAERGIVPTFGAEGVARGVTLADLELGIGFHRHRDRHPIRHRRVIDDDQTIIPHHLAEALARSGLQGRAVVAIGQGQDRPHLEVVHRAGVRRVVTVGAHRRPAETRVRIAGAQALQMGEIHLDHTRPTDRSRARELARPEGLAGREVRAAVTAEPIARVGDIPVTGVQRRGIRIRKDVALEFPTTARGEVGELEDGAIRLQRDADPVVSLLAEHRVRVRIRHVGALTLRGATTGVARIPEGSERAARRGVEDLDLVRVHDAEPRPVGIHQVGLAVVDGAELDAQRHVGPALLLGGEFGAGVGVRVATGVGVFVGVAGLGRRLLGVIRVAGLGRRTGLFTVAGVAAVRSDRRVRAPDRDAGFPVARVGVVGAGDEQHDREGHAELHEFLEGAHGVFLP